MKRKSLYLIACVLMGFSTFALAETELTKINCDEFNQLEKDAQQKIIFSAVGYNRSSGLGDEILGVDENDRLVTQVIEECKNNPKKLLLSTVSETQKKSRP